MNTSRVRKIKKMYLLKKEKGILLSIILVSPLKERKNIQLLSNKLIDQISKNNLTGLVEIISHMSTSQTTLEDMVLASGGNFFLALDKEDINILIDLSEIIINLEKNFTQEYFKMNFEEKEYIIYNRNKIISLKFEL